jgi:WD40 repeat protein
VFNPDGTRIVTASADGTAKVWDPDGTLLETLRGHTDGLFSAVFNPDGMRIVTASWDDTARLWSPTGER